MQDGISSLREDGILRNLIIFGGGLGTRDMDDCAQLVCEELSV